MVVTVPANSEKVANYLHCRQAGRAGSHCVKFTYSIHLKYSLSACYVPGINEQNKVEERREEGTSFTIPGKFQDTGMRIKTTPKITVMFQS